MKMSSPQDSKPNLQTGFRRGSSPVCPPAGVGGATPAATISKWQRERCHWFHKIFTNIERRMARGWRLHECLVFFAWYYRTHHRFYRCDRSRRFRAAYGTLLQSLYIWREGGRRPEALALKFRSGADRIGAARLDKFIETAVSSGAISYVEAYAALRDKSVTLISYRDALSPRTRALLGGLFTLRRQAAYMGRVILRTLPPA